MVTHWLKCRPDGTVTPSIESAVEFLAMVTVNDTVRIRVKGQCQCLALVVVSHVRIGRAHSFPRAAEFRAEPRNLAVAAEFPCFYGISQNSA